MGKRKHDKLFSVSLSRSRLLSQLCRKYSKWEFPSDTGNDGLDISLKICFHLPQI